MNATCAIHGHDWFWRHALRLRMCARCLRIDVPAPREAGERHAPSPGVLTRSSASQVAAKVA